MGSISFLGLASGTDWNSVIDQLVAVERQPLDKITAQRVKVAFNQRVMTRINQQFTKFNTTLSNLRFESTFLSRQVEASNRGRVSATAEAGAAVGTYNVEVSRLARASRATSGLGGELYSKVANLAATQTMGIGALIPYGDFQPTRALGTTLIKDTVQAGRAGAGITAGDTISISGNLKDGTAVSGTFTFNGDTTDTLDRLAVAIAQVFHGEVAASVGSNGEITLIEADPSIAGDITFNTTVPPLGIVFNDNDYSGSTLTFGIGNNVAGAGATARRLVHQVAFTTAGVLELNGATGLNALDQTAGSLDNGDIVRITGKDMSGANIAPADFTFTGAETINDLVAAITAAFGSATASYANGRIVLTDNATGSSQLELNLEFIDQGAASAFTLGGFNVAETGRAAVAQMVTTGSFTVEGVGDHLLSSTDGRGGKIHGTVTLPDPSNTLSSFGVTEFDMFSIDPDGTGGTLGPVAITGLSEYSTLQDLVDAINTQVPMVTAALTDAGGSYRLEITANQGGRDIRLYDDANGIIDRIFAVGQTDLDSTTNDGVNTFTSTTATTDVTIVSTFQPANGGPVQRNIWTGAEGSPIQGLIGGVAISGGAGTFNSGVATIVTRNSSELNTQQETYTYLFGSDAIASSPPTQIPPLNPAQTLATAGFATTPQNASASPLFHTDGFFTVNGVRITVGDVNTTTVYEVLARINSSGAGVTAFYDQANNRFYLRSNSTGPVDITLGGQGDTSNFLQLAGLTTTTGGVTVLGQQKGTVDRELPLAQGGFTDTISSGVFTINGTRIAIDAGVDTLDEVIQKINRSGAGVTASYDQASDTFTLTQKLDAPNPGTRITIGDVADTSNFLEAMQLTVDTTVSSQIGNVRQTARFSINDVEFERAGNTVTDVLDKVTLNLNALTEGPETITISADTERIKSAILDFVVDYNTTMELINAKPLTKEERAATAELTNEKANTMTVQQIEDYLATREELLTRQFVASDNSLKQIQRRIQNLIQGPVTNSGPYGSLSVLGLSTAEVGAGADSAAVSQGRLLGPTSDRATLEQLLDSNAGLLAAIESDSDGLFTLFANLMESRYTHSGTRDLSSGISVAGTLRFTLGDGQSSTQVNFNSGSYSQNTVLNRINQALNNAGMGSTVLAYYDANNQLNLRSAQTNSTAQLEVRDESLGAASILDAFGWNSGIFFGPDPQVSGGVARRAREYITNITQTGGIVMERIKQGGAFDRQLQVYDDTIGRMEANLSEYQQRLRTKFARLETSLSQLNSQSSAIESAIAKMNANSGN